MKKFLIYYGVFVFVLILSFILFELYTDLNYKHKFLYKGDDGIYMSSRINNKSFEVYSNGDWKKITIKGVNMGLGEPYSYPGDYSIDKKTYLRWFKEIKKMNANTIRVYTLQSKSFYDALYEYNYRNDDPIYIIHGIYLDENLLEKYNDIFKDNVILNDTLDKSHDVIKALHGDLKTKTFYGGSYNYDVSRYVIGYIAGIEFDAELIHNTNKNNPKVNSFKGNYFSVSNGKAFDVFLAMFEDEIASYEMENYSTQKPIAITNWLTTDPLKHPNEPFYKEEDSETIDIEKIKLYNYKAGTFASYHVYPYYPEFLNYDKKYVKKNADGNVDTYKAYLEDLTNYHSVPVLVSEVGLPTSRGECHSAIYSHFNQGGLSEKEQGEYLSSLIDDIVSTDNTLGFLIFSWQDEWFKRSWNTVDFDDENGRSNWLNVQTAEQNFGLLSFDLKNKIVIDGVNNEWKKSDVFIKNNDFSLSIKEDSEYLYLLVKTGDNFNFNDDTIIIPFDTLENSGNKKYKNIKLSNPSEFILKIHGKDDTRIYVDSYYDSFYYLYGHLNHIIDRNKENEKKNSGKFNKIKLILNKALFLPESKDTIEVETVETGKLRYGSTDSKSKNYNSLSDFYVKNGYIELRIPWAILGFSNPTKNEIIDELYLDKQINFKHIESINIGIGLNSSQKIDLQNYSLKNKSNAKYVERLKDSYFILQKRLESIK